ncbi:hypothetical protein GCM10028799_43270 [Kribbella italica]
MGHEHDADAHPGDQQDEVTGVGGGAGGEAAHEDLLRVKRMFGCAFNCSLRKATESSPKTTG